MIVVSGLADTTFYGSGENALNSLLRFPLPPSIIEQNERGLIFRYFVWPPTEETDLLPWPATEEEGVRIAYTGESYLPSDLRKARHATPEIATLATNYFIRWYSGGWTKSRNPCHLVFFGLGVSKQAGEAIFRWLPVGQTHRVGEYPRYLLEFDLDQVLDEVLSSPDTYRLRYKQRLYTKPESIWLRYPYLKEWFTDEDVFASLSGKPYGLLPLQVGPLKLLGIDKAGVPREGGNPRHPRR